MLVLTVDLRLGRAVLEGYLSVLGCPSVLGGCPSVPGGCLSVLRTGAAVVACTVGAGGLVVKGFGVGLALCGLVIGGAVVGLILRFGGGGLWMGGL